MVFNRKLFIQLDLFRSEFIPSKLTQMKQTKIINRVILNIKTNIKSYIFFIGPPDFSSESELSSVLDPVPLFISS